MKTIEERAKEYAGVHKATEFNYFGVGQAYGYERIYNAEITAYERGAKEQKTIDEERIAELEKEKASLILEINNKNKIIAELKAMEE